MNKKTLAILLAVVLVVAALLTVYFITRPETTEGMKSFTLVVEHKNGEEKEFELKSDAEYLGDALQKEGIISGEEGAYGLYIHVVDGERAVYEKDNAYWGVYIGEESASVGIDQIPIEEGKVYKLVYTPA